MASKNFSDSDAPIADINITPFVDIILVVLIIFMVTTPMIMKPSIAVQLPKASSGDKSTATQLSVTVSSSGQIQMNGSDITLENLGAASKELLAKDPELQAIISADQNTSHGQVISVLDAIKSAGVRRFAISTDKK